MSLWTRLWGNESTVIAKTRAPKYNNQIIHGVVPQENREEVILRHSALSLLHFRCFFFNHNFWSLFQSPLYTCYKLQFFTCWTSVGSFHVLHLNLSFWLVSSPHHVCTSASMLVQLVLAMFSWGTTPWIIWLLYKINPTII